MENNEKIESFWQKFLAETGRDINTKYYEAFYFGDSEALANELLALILEGKKTATSSSLWAYEVEGEELPKVGGLSVVTDWDGNPHCVIETVAATLLPFSEMTFEICKREGEDETLESWRDGHIRFFTDEGEEVGYTFSEEMPILFEDFEVIYKA